MCVICRSFYISPEMGGDIRCAQFENVTLKYIYIYIIGRKLQR